MFERERERERERESFIYFCVGSQSQITVQTIIYVKHQIFYGGFLVRGSEKTKRK